MYYLFKHFIRNSINILYANYFPDYVPVRPEMVVYNE